MKRDLFQLDSTLKEPLYLQLYKRFVLAIQKGQLKANTRIPSIRSLASELNISRGTVELAYQILVSEGLLETKGSLGSFISEAGAKLAKNPHGQTDQSSFNIAQQPRESTINPFQLGLPALDAFPLTLWNRITNRISRSETSINLGYPDPQGDLGLRQALTGYLAIARGVHCVPEQIFINSGYRSSLGLIRETLFQLHDQGWYEDPGYFIARHFLQSLNLSLIPVPVDEEGVQVNTGIAIANQAKFAIITPTHQSPTNVTLSLERRLALLQWANSQEAWIIEDDYDSEFHYHGRVLPTLKSLDSEDRVIYCGTFSKTLFPALRLSYIVVPQTKIRDFKDKTHLLGNHAPLLPQKVIQHFIEEGHFSRHLRKMRNLYRERRQFLIDAIETVLQEELIIHPQMGGMHLVVTIADKNAPSISISELIKRLKEDEVIIQSIDHWYQSPPKKSALLLGFTNITSQEMALTLCQKLKKHLLPEQ